MHERKKKKIIFLISFYCFGEWTVLIILLVSTVHSKKNSPIGEAAVDSFWTIFENWLTKIAKKYIYIYIYIFVSLLKMLLQSSKGRLCKIQGPKNSILGKHNKNVNTYGTLRQDFGGDVT
jgi:hypothetical protein